MKTSTLLSAPVAVAVATGIALAGFTPKALSTPQSPSNGLIGMVASAAASTAVMAVEIVWPIRIPAKKVVKG